MESTTDVQGTDRIKYRVLMLGLDKAGKTSLLFKLKNGEVLSTAPTLGYHNETIKYQGEHLVLWDIGGLPQLRKVWSKYYDEKCDKTHGILFVVDAVDKDRIEESKIELHRLLLEDKLRGVPIVILANKQDIEDVMYLDELSQALDIKNDNPCILVGSSAVTGEGLQEALKLLVFGMKVFIKAGS